MRIAAFTAALVVLAQGWPAAAARVGGEPASPPAACVALSFGAPNPLRASGRERRVVTQAMLIGVERGVVRHPPVFAYPREEGCAVEAGRPGRNRAVAPRGLSGAGAALPDGR